MRSVVAFYRARPLVGALVFAIGLAITIATVMLRDGGGLVLPIAMCALAGLIVGSVLAVGQRRRSADDAAAALDPTDPRDAGR